LIRGDLDQSQIWIRGDLDLRNKMSRNYTHLMNLLEVTIAAFDETISVVSEGAAKAIQDWLQPFCDMCVCYLAVSDRQLFAAAHALLPTQNGFCSGSQSRRS
jgi:hypothetical protein